MCEQLCGISRRRRNKTRGRVVVAVVHQQRKISAYCKCLAPESNLKVCTCCSFELGGRDQRYPMGLRGKGLLAASGPDMLVGMPSAPISLIPNVL